MVLNSCHESDSARMASAACDGVLAVVQVQDQQAQLASLRSQLEQQRQTAAQSVKAAAAAQVTAAAAEAEASTHAARVAEVEHEMVQLLAAVEAQKVSSAQKMRQLASLLHDM